MISIRCDNCNTKYALDDSKFNKDTVKGRCKKCNSVVVLHKTETGWTASTEKKTWAELLKICPKCGAKYLESKGCAKCHIFNKNNSGEIEQSSNQPIDIKSIDSERAKEKNENIENIHCTSSEEQDEQNDNFSPKNLPENEIDNSLSGQRYRNNSNYIYCIIIVSLLSGVIFLEKSHFFSYSEKFFIFSITLSLLIIFSILKLNNSVNHKIDFSDLKKDTKYFNRIRLLIIRESAKGKIVLVASIFLFMGIIFDYTGKTEINWILTTGEVGIHRDGALYHENMALSESVSKSSKWNKNEKILMKGYYRKILPSISYNDGPDGHADFGKYDDFIDDIRTRDRFQNFRTNIKLEFDEKTVEFMKSCNDNNKFNGSMISEVELDSLEYLEIIVQADGFRAMLYSIASSDSYFRCNLDPESSVYDPMYSFVEFPEKPEILIRKPLFSIVFLQIAVFLFIEVIIIFFLLRSQTGRRFFNKFVKTKI